MTGTVPGAVACGEAATTRSALPHAPGPPAITNNPWTLRSHPGPAQLCRLACELDVPGGERVEFFDKPVNVEPHLGPGNSGWEAFSAPQPDFADGGDG